MKTLLVCASTAALLLVGAATQTPAEPGGDSLLKNPSFEAGTGLPDGWSHSGPLDGVAYLWDDGASRTGKKSIGFEKTTQRYFPIARWYQEIPYDGHSAAIEFSGWVKAEGMHKAVLDVQFEGGPQTTHHWVAYIGSKSATESPATHDWTKYGGVANIPSGTKTIIVSFQDYGPGKAWLDDVSAKYVPAAAAGGE